MPIEVFFKHILKAKNPLAKRMQVKQRLNPLTCFLPRLGRPDQVYPTGLTWNLWFDYKPNQRPLFDPKTKWKPKNRLNTKKVQKNMKKLGKNESNTKNIEHEEHSNPNSSNMNSNPDHISWNKRHKRMEINH